jgi:hypothetical protein
MKLQTLSYLLPLAMLLVPGTISAQYQIDWNNAGGGSGSATGGVYVVNATIGQDAAGAGASGPYGLVNGFWGVIGAVPTPGAPLLLVQRAGAQVRIAWSVTATNFVLEQTTSLVGSPAISWATGNYAYQTNGSQISVTIPASPSRRYFRLRKP